MPKFFKRYILLIVSVVSFLFLILFAIREFQPEYGTVNAAIDNTLLFSVDFNQNPNDSINNIIPTGSVVGYELIEDGNYGAVFDRAQNTGLKYDITSFFADSMTATTGFTVSTRVKFTKIDTGFGGIVGRYTKQPGQRQFVLTTYNNKLIVAAPPAGSESPVYRDFTDTVSTNTWYNLVYTFDGTDHRTFLNGVLVNKSAGTINENNSVPLEIGRFNLASSDSMTGVIDYVYVWEGALTAGEVLEHYSDIVSEDTFVPTPIFQADFNNSLLDSINNILPTGTIKRYVDLGEDNYAAEFSIADATGLSYDIAPIESKFNSSKGFTVGTRVKIFDMPWEAYPSAGSYHSIGGRYALAAGKRQFILSGYRDCGGANKKGLCLYAVPSGSNSPSCNLVFISPATTNTWYNLVYVYDGRKQYTYLNGELVGVLEQTINTPTDVPLEIGSFGNGGINGQIDKFYVWEGAAKATDMDTITELLGLSGVPSVDPPGPTSVAEEDQLFVNSEGLNIQYDIYYKTGQKGPIVIMGDSWGSNKDSYRSYVKQMRDTYNFVGITVNTRGKGLSTGHRDALGYECRDMYELIEYVKQNYSDYIDLSLGVHIMGFSAGGGKSLVCTGRYPDYFTSAYATGSVASLSKWYETINELTNPADRPSLRERTGNSVNPGIIFYHPTGFDSVDGSIENQEAYDARDASIIGAYNSLSKIYATHYDGDPRVNVSLTRQYTTNRSSYGRTNEYLSEECSGGTHAVCNMNKGMEWINNRKGLIDTPTSGTFKIGGWVETKKFRVEFKDDVGYTGEVDFNIYPQDRFKFVVRTTSYTGPTEILLKGVENNDIEIFDNNVSIGVLKDGVLQNTNVENSMIYDSTKKTLSFVISQANGHTIEGRTYVEPPLNPPVIPPVIPSVTPVVTPSVTPSQPKVASFLWKLEEKKEEIETDNLEDSFDEEKDVDESKEQSTHLIRIKVTDSNGQPVANAKVVLGSTSKVVFTDEKGFAVFENVEPGNYTVLITYGDVKGEYSVNVGEGEESEVSFELKDKEDSKSVFKKIALIGVLCLSGLGVGVFLFRKTGQPKV